MVSYNVMNAEPTQKDPLHCLSAVGRVFSKFQNISLFYFQKDLFAFIKQIEGAVKMICAQRDTLVRLDHIG